MQLAHQHMAHKSSQGSQNQKRDRSSMDVPPGRCILWTLLSARPFALLMGKPTSAKSLCCGLSPALPLMCPVAPHQVRRVVIPKPRAQAPLLRGRAKTLQCWTPLAELSLCNGNPTWTLVSDVGRNLLKWKEQAVGRPVKGMVGLQM